MTIKCEHCLWNNMCAVDDFDECDDYTPLGDAEDEAIDSKIESDFNEFFEAWKVYVDHLDENDIF